MITTEHRNTLSDHAFHQEFLSDYQLRARAPSIFTERAHESRSSRYAYIPTTNVVDALRNEGFFPVHASQSRCRFPSKAPFTKHMITFQRQHDRYALKVDDTIPQVALVNSHDGSSRYKLLASVLRIWCLNGAMVQWANLGEVNIQHTGKITDQVIEGSYRIIGQSTKALEHIERFRSIQLHEGEQVLFAQEAAKLRFEPEQMVNPRDLLEVRREADTGNDLWTVFNRVQESLIRGGATYRTQKGRLIRVRPVVAIDRNIKVNQALWSMAEQVAALKAAA